jgi:hypothetical protein
VSDAPLQKLTKEADSQEYLDAVEKAEPDVDALAEQIVEQLNIPLPSPSDSP